MLHLKPCIIGIALGLVFHAGTTTGAVANDRIPPFSVAKAFNHVAVRHGASDDNAPTQIAPNLSLGATTTSETVSDTGRARTLFEAEAIGDASLCPSRRLTTRYIEGGIAHDADRLK
jgi:hypothetical protein